MDGRLPKCSPPRIEARTITIHGVVTPSGSHFFCKHIKIKTEHDRTSKFDSILLEFNIVSTWCSKHPLYRRYCTMHASRLDFSSGQRFIFRMAVEHFWAPAASATCRTAVSASRRPRSALNSRSPVLRLIPLDSDSTDFQRWLGRRSGESNRPRAVQHSNLLWGGHDVEASSSWRLPPSLLSPPIR